MGEFHTMMWHDVGSKNPKGIQLIEDRGSLVRESPPKLILFQKIGDEIAWSTWSYAPMPPHKQGLQRNNEHLNSTNFLQGC